MAVKIWMFCLFLLATGECYAQNEKWKAWEVEADTMIGQQNYGDAVKLYTRIIDQSKLKERSLYTLLYKRAVGYYNLDQFENSLADLNRFIPEFPEMEHARLLRAFVYKELGEEDHQLEDLNTLIQSAPSNRELLRIRASVYLDKEDYAAAKKDLLAIKAQEDDAETEMYLGSAYYYGGYPDSALLSLNRAIELDASYLPPYLYAGFFCIQEDEFDLAVKYLDVAIKIDPSSRPALFYKGIALVESKREKEGCRCLTKAFEAGEDDAADYLKEYCYGIDD